MALLQEEFLNDKYQSKPHTKMGNHSEITKVEILCAMYKKLISLSDLFTKGSSFLIQLILENASKASVIIQNWEQAADKEVSCEGDQNRY